MEHRHFPSGRPYQTSPLVRRGERISYNHAGEG